MLFEGILRGKNPMSPGSPKAEKGHPVIAYEYYTHQVIELPKIKMDVTHFVLHKGVCSRCGKVCKGVIPQEHRTGFGPRLTALIAEMAGT